jgi:hypothetical protein
MTSIKKLRNRVKACQLREYRSKSGNCQSSKTSRGLSRVFRGILKLTLKKTPSLISTGYPLDSGYPTDP